MIDLSGKDTIPAVIRFTDEVALADLRGAAEFTGKEQAEVCCEIASPAMQNLRSPIDRLKMMVSGSRSSVFAVLRFSVMSEI